MSRMISESIIGGGGEYGARGEREMHLLKDEGIRQALEGRETLERRRACG